MTVRRSQRMGRSLGAALAISWMLASVVVGQVVTRPGGTSVPGLPAPPISNGSNAPLPGGGNSGVGGALTPSWTPPATPVPKVTPHVARPATGAPAARAPKRLCEVTPGANGCRGSATPDGGGSDDTSCNCARDLCRSEQIPGQSLMRRYCYKAG